MSISLTVLNWNPVYPLLWKYYNIIFKRCPAELSCKQAKLNLHSSLHCYIINTVMHCMCVLHKHVECSNLSQKMCRAVFRPPPQSFANSGLFQPIHSSLQTSAPQLHCYISLFCHIGDYYQTGKIAVAYTQSTCDCEMISRGSHRVAILGTVTRLWYIEAYQTAPVLQTHVSALVWDSRQKRHVLHIFMYLTWTQAQKVNRIKLNISGCYPR